MTEIDDIEPVAVEPDYCGRCGTALETAEWEGSEHPYCPSCKRLLSRAPVAGAHVVVRDGDRALVLDEPVPGHDGVLSLPGGWADPGEGPKEAAARELGEGTGLRVAPEALSFVTIVHAEFPDAALYLITYTVERARTAGDLRPEAGDVELAFRSPEELGNAGERLRESDRDRVESAFEG